MKVEEMIKWLSSLDPEMVVVIEGLIYSSNLHKDTGEFYVYTESLDFSTRNFNIEDGRLYIGVDV